jgi:hypothetical protein
VEAVLKHRFFTDVAKPEVARAQRVAEQTLGLMARGEESPFDDAEVAGGMGRVKDKLFVDSIVH